MNKVIKAWLSFDTENLHSRNDGSNRMIKVMRPLSGVMSRLMLVAVDELNAWYNKSKMYDVNSKKMSIFSINDSHCK